MISTLLLSLSLQFTCPPFLTHPPGVSTVPNTTLGCDEISNRPVWLSMLNAPSERGGLLVFTVADTPTAGSPTMAYGMALSVQPAATPGIQFPGTTTPFCTWHVLPDMVFFGVVISGVPCYQIHLWQMPPIPGLRGLLLRGQLYGEDTNPPRRRFVTNVILLQVQP